MPCYPRGRSGVCITAMSAGDHRAGKAVLRNLARIVALAPIPDGT